MNDSIVRCDVCKGSGQAMSRWAVETGGRKTRCPKCLGRGRIPRSALRSERVARINAKRHSVLDEVERIAEARQRELDSDTS